MLYRRPFVSDVGNLLHRIRPRNPVETLLRTVEQTMHSGCIGGQHAYGFIPVPRFSLVTLVQSSNPTVMLSQSIGVQTEGNLCKVAIFKPGCYWFVNLARPTRKGYQLRRKNATYSHLFPIVAGTIYSDADRQNDTYSPWTHWHHPGVLPGMPYTRSEQAVLREFGERVRSAREDRGWSQEKLAEQAGLDRTYVGSIERGERNLALLNVNKLALALGEGVVGFLPCRAGRSGKR